MKTVTVQLSRGGGGGGGGGVRRIFEMDVNPNLPYLDWGNDEPSGGNARLHRGTRWVIRKVPDYEKWRAWKHCYVINDDVLRWVPLSGSYDSFGEAQEAVKDYISRSAENIYLNDKGEVLK